MQRAILRFVGGYKAARVNPVTQRQIRNHFAATRWEFVSDTMYDLIATDQLYCGRNGLGGKVTVFWLGGNIVIAEKA